MLMVYCLITVISIFLAGQFLWDRFRSRSDIDRCLAIEGLASLCADYLYYVKQMIGGQLDTETVRQLDSQRQVTHNQILQRLGLTRDDIFDMVRFARLYLDQHAPPEVWEGDIDE